MSFPEPTAQTYPVYLVRKLIEEGNGLGVVVLPDLPKQIYAGTFHSFLIRTDIPTEKLAVGDFNKDNRVDVNDCNALEKAVGRTGNSVYDIASCDVNAPNTLYIGTMPDEKVDESDRKAIYKLAGLALPHATHTLVVSSSAGGSVSSPGVGQFSYGRGVCVSLVASPQAGYGFANWTGSAVDAGSVANPSAANTSVIIGADYTLQANFDSRFYNEGSVLGGSYPTSWNVYGDGYFVGDADVYKTYKTISFEGCPTFGYSTDADHSYMIFRHIASILPEHTIEVTFAGVAAGTTGNVAIDIWLSTDDVHWSLLGSTPENNWVTYKAYTVSGQPHLNGDNLYVKVSAHKEPLNAAIYTEKVNVFIH